jgi:hypothetical protein
MGSLVQIIVVVVLILVCIVLVYAVVQINADAAYMVTETNNLDDVHRYIALVQHNPFADATQHFRAADLHLRVDRNYTNALEEYFLARDMGIDDILILDRINEFPVQQFRHIHIDFRPREVDDIPDLVEWTEDTQNVHDHNINASIADSYRNIKKRVGSACVEIKDIIIYINETYKCADGERKHIPAAISILQRIREDNAHVMALRTSEKEFICTAFTRILVEPDPKKKQVMLENLVMNLSNCKEPGNDICTTGRVVRVMSSFTDMLDEAPDAGMLHTHQAIRNEIYTKAATIRDKELGMASPDDVKKYDLDDPDDKLKPLITQKIDSMLVEYAESLNPNQLESVRREILSAL